MLQSYPVNSGSCSTASSEKIKRLVKHKRKQKRKRNIYLSISYFFLIALALVFLLPFFLMVFKSFMTEVESLGIPEIRFLPSKWVLSNYTKAIDLTFLNYFKNTMIIMGVNLIAIPLSSSLCAFGFAKCQFPGRNFLFGVTLSTMMLPSIVVQIPLFVMFYKMDWINTFYPFTIPSFLGGGAINIFLIRQFIKSLPKELDEAASMDGANKFQIYYKIVLPLCVPVLIFVMIGVFNGCWNDFQGPLLYLRKPEVHTLALGIYYRYAGQISVDNYPSYQMATGVAMIIPPAIVFFIFQRQLIDGVVMSGIKG